MFNLVAKCDPDFNANKIEYNRCQATLPLCNKWIVPFDF